MAPIERPAIAPLRPALRQTCHSPAEPDRLKQAPLDIRETVGVQFQSDKALGVPADHGLRIDKATQVARFPAALVLEATSRAPRRFGLGARDESRAIEVGDGNTYAAPKSSAAGP